MAMTMGEVAVSPDAYIAAISGWQRGTVEMLRTAINAGGDFEESIKWTNLLFASNGQCLVIRAEDHRVILAIFRGKRLKHFDARIKPSGKYELANLIMTEETQIDPAIITQLSADAIALNAELGDPAART